MFDPVSSLGRMINMDLVIVVRSCLEGGPSTL